MSKSSVPAIVQEWVETFTRSGTQTVYSDIMGHYFYTYLASNYPSVEAWIEKIVKDQDTRAIRSRRVVELKHYLDSYVSPRRLTLAAILQFRRTVPLSN